VPPPSKKWESNSNKGEIRRLSPFKRHPVFSLSDYMKIFIRRKVAEKKHIDDDERRRRLAHTSHCLSFVFAVQTNIIYIKCVIKPASALSWTLGKLLSWMCLSRTTV